MDEVVNEAYEYKEFVRHLEETIAASSLSKVSLNLKGTQ